MSFMKNAALLAVIVPGAAYAQEMTIGGESVRPYVGLEYNYIVTDVNSQAYDLDTNGFNDYAGEPYEDSYHALVPNIGVRIGEYFGAELGYLRSTEESKGLSGADFLAGTSGKTETRLTGWNLDLNGYIPVTEQLEAIGSVGVGRYEADYDYSGNIIAGGLNFGGVNLSDTDKDTALRVGAGLQYNVSENVSLRGMVRYIDLEFEDTGVTQMDGAWIGAAGVSYAF